MADNGLGLLLSLKAGSCGAKNKDSVDIKTKAGLSGLGGGSQKNIQPVSQTDKQPLSKSVGPAAVDLQGVCPGSPLFLAKMLRASQSIHPILPPEPFR